MKVIELTYMESSTISLRLSSDFPLESPSATWIMPPSMRNVSSTNGIEALASTEREDPHSDELVADLELTLNSGHFPEALFYLTDIC